MKVIFSLSYLTKVKIHGQRPSNQWLHWQTLIQVGVQRTLCIVCCVIIISLLLCSPTSDSICSTIFHKNMYFFRFTLNFIALFQFPANLPQENKFPGCINTLSEHHKGSKVDARETKILENTRDHLGTTWGQGYSKYIGWDVNWTDWMDVYMYRLDPTL